MENVYERLSRSDELVGYAMLKVDADSGSSPVLNAIMKEFRNKSNKALGALKDADEQTTREFIFEVEQTTREFIFEVEQAADSAKVAAEAEQGVADDTRKSVLDAHMSLCMLKSEL